MITLLQLATLLRPWLAAEDVPALPELSLAGATADSRQIHPGMLFCAIRGAKQDGNRYAKQAVASGASAILSAAAADCPELQGLSVPILRLRPGTEYHAVARVAAAFAKNPASQLRLWAITGTCGKTTTAYLLRDILRAAGRKCGMIGTVLYDLGGREIPADRTTPTPFEIQALLREMVDNGCTDAILEYSSAALDQERLGEVKITGAIFTNFSRDHLDYHGSMEAYLAAKKNLFMRWLADGAPAVINVDDEAGAALAQELQEEGRVAVLAFTLKNGTPLKTQLPGRFNEYNALAAATLAGTMGIPEEVIGQALSHSKGAPGRLERVLCRNGVQAFIDYAHTPEEIKKALAALRPLCNGHALAIVFGCGGERDSGKRPLMGEAASAADMLWITDDNPRMEDPEAIVKDILPGILPGKPFWIQHDRARAITEAVRALSEGDLLLIAGKGHEPYQEIGGVKHPMLDRELLRPLE